MRLEPCRIKLWSTGYIKCVECIPLCETSGAVVLLERNTLCPVKSTRRKCKSKDRQNLMSEAAFVGKYILHENRRSKDIHSDTKFFSELAYDR